MSFSGRQVVRWWVERRRGRDTNRGRKRESETEDAVKDNECGRHRQMWNVYAFSFWNLNEFFIAIHKKSINISPGESEGEREREGETKGPLWNELS